MKRLIKNQSQLIETLLNELQICREDVQIRREKQRKGKHQTENFQPIMNENGTDAKETVVMQMQRITMHMKELAEMREAFKLSREELKMTRKEADKKFQKHLRDCDVTNKLYIAKCDEHTKSLLDLMVTRERLKTKTYQLEGTEEILTIYKQITTNYSETLRGRNRFAIRDVRAPTSCCNIL